MWMLARGESLLSAFIVGLDPDATVHVLKELYDPSQDLQAEGLGRGLCVRRHTVGVSTGTEQRAERAHIRCTPRSPACGDHGGTTNDHHRDRARREDRKSTRLNSSHLGISYAVFCLKKK